MQVQAHPSNIRLTYKGTLRGLPARLPGKEKPSIFRFYMLPLGADALALLPYRFPEYPLFDLTQVTEDLKGVCVESNDG